MLKYLWMARFEDGTVLTQPEDDRYSKHDDTLSHNPSSFRDILDYQEKSPLRSFMLTDPKGLQAFSVELTTGVFIINGTPIMLDQPLEELTDRKLIYYRTNRTDMVTHETWTHAYNFGYEGKDCTGKVVKKVVTIL